MSVAKILSENWDEYDNKKIRDGRDRRFFACSEPWEVDFLVKQTKKHYPKSSDIVIRAAISSCCRTIGSPHPRQTFIECMVAKL